MCEITSFDTSDFATIDEMGAPTGLFEVPTFRRLADRERVLIAGAGGGFDVFAGLPLYFALRAAGKVVSLANLTFTNLRGTSARWLAPHLAEVTIETTGEDAYFPERRLVERFAARGDALTVHAFEKVGVAPMRRAYEALVAQWRSISAST